MMRLNAGGGRGWVGGALLMTAVSACGAHDMESHLRAGVPFESGIAEGHVHHGWLQRSLRDASADLHAAFAQQGSEAMLRLRLRAPDVRALFNPATVERISRLTPGLAPTPGEQRWQMFRRFEASVPMGFCARGVRLAEPGGADGTRERMLFVDRLLIIGSDGVGLWGAWVEGLVLTSAGWRLLPTVPRDRQVETPRRDHADVQLWDCDEGIRPTSPS